MGEKNYTAKGAKYGFFFDQTLCTGCKACQIACIDKHDLPTGVRWRRVIEYSGGTWQISGDTFNPSSSRTTRQSHATTARTRSA